MSRQRALILPLFICALLTANAQTRLQLGTPVERTLGPNGVYDFSVNLEENTLIQFVVEQRGIDVVVKVFSPGGKSMGEFDSPNGADGPEHVSFVAAAGGGYRISVSALDPNNPSSGKFEIKILELRQATEQEIKASKNLEVVKAKGVALLAELDGLIAEIKSPFTRIQAQIQAAQLIWSSDEKRGARYFADATNGFKEFIGSVDPTSENYPQQYSSISQLRFEIIRLLGERDPDAALSFLYSSVPPSNPYDKRDNDAQEAMLEIQIANQIMRNDPNRALQIARTILKSGRYTESLIDTVGILRRQNPELAAQLASAIASKLVNEKLLKNEQAAVLAIRLLRFGQGAASRGQPVNSNGNAAQAGLLLDSQYRDLLQRALTDALSFSMPPSRNYTPEQNAAWRLLSGLQQFGPELDTIVTGGAAAVDKKLAELKNPGSPDNQKYEQAIASGPVDAALGIIEKAPAEQRDQLYLQLAGREASSGDIARARQIVNERVTNPYQRRSSLSNFDRQEIYFAISKGKIEEALRLIGGIRNPKERAGFLAQMANQIGPGQKRANAMLLLEQAKAMLAPSQRAEDQEAMSALFEIARAFSKYDLKRSFEILDPLIDQFNEICTAARTMEGFGQENYEDDEINMQSGGSLAQLAQRLSTLLGTLAVTNFERARAASERINLPEVRLKVYLDIAQQTIQGATR